MKNISPICTYKPDIIFILETSTGYQALSEIKDYRKYADENIHDLNHGGIAMYVQKLLILHVIDVKYGNGYKSFRLDYAPRFLFIGMYIQPENSLYFNESMFCDLSTMLLEPQEKKLIPILGDDMNCRFGNLKIYFMNVT